MLNTVIIFNVLLFCRCVREQDMGEHIAVEQVWRSGDNVVESVLFPSPRVFQGPNGDRQLLWS